MYVNVQCNYIMHYSVTFLQFQGIMYVLYNNSLILSLYTIVITVFLTNIPLYECWQGYKLCFNRGLLLVNLYKTALLVKNFHVCCTAMLYVKLNCFIPMHDATQKLISKPKVINENVNEANIFQPIFFTFVMCIYVL